VELLTVITSPPSVAVFNMNTLQSSPPSTLYTRPSPFSLLDSSLSKPNHAKHTHCIIFSLSDCTSWHIL